MEIYKKITTSNFPFRIINISIINGPPFLKEHYWESMRINEINEILSTSTKDECPLLKIPFPANFKDSESQEIVLHLFNTLSWNAPLTFKRIQICDCTRHSVAVGINRFKKVFDCPHRKLIKLNPTNDSVLPKKFASIHLTINYSLAGTNSIIYNFWSSCFKAKFEFIVSITEFDPLISVLTKNIFPIRIDINEPPVQNIRLYNPYLTDMNYRIESLSQNVEVLKSEVILKSKEIGSLLIKFKPDNVKDYELNFTFSSKSVEMPLCIKGQGIKENILLPSSICPDTEISIKKTPVVLHKNYISVKLQQKSYVDKMFVLHNQSDYCIKFNWSKDFVESFYSIKLTPECGIIKSKSAKSIMIRIISENSPCIFCRIPIECLIFKYDTKHWKKSRNIDEYFEYTEEGYYENLPSLPQSREERILSVFLNVNLRVLSDRNIDKLLSIEQQLSLNPSRKEESAVIQELSNPFDRNLIEKVLWDVIFNDQFKYHFNSESEINAKNVKMIIDKRPITNFMDELLRETVIEISMKHRFIPPP